MAGLRIPADAVMTVKGRGNVRPSMKNQGGHNAATKVMRIVFHVGCLPCATNRCTTNHAPPFPTPASNVIPAQAGIQFVKLILLPQYFLFCLAPWHMAQGQRRCFLHGRSKQDSADIMYFSDTLDSRLRGNDGRNAGMTVGYGPYSYHYERRVTA